MIKWPDFKTYKIYMKNREDFNKVSDWEKEIKDFNVVDIGYSDMCFVFDNIENMEDFLGMIVMNHMETTYEI